MDYTPEVRAYLAVKARADEAVKRAEKSVDEALSRVQKILDDLSERWRIPS